jgi:hypothetical protein
MMTAAQNGCKKGEVHERQLKTKEVSIPESEAQAVYLGESYRISSIAGIHYQEHTAKKCYMHIYLDSRSCPETHGVSSISSPSLQVSKLKHREAKSLPQL